MCAPVISQVLLGATSTIRMAEETSFVWLPNRFGEPTTIQQLLNQQRFTVLNTSFTNRVMPMVDRRSLAKTLRIKTLHAPSVILPDRQPWWFLGETSATPDGPKSIPDIWLLKWHLQIDHRRITYVWILIPSLKPAIMKTKMARWCTWQRRNAALCHAPRTSTTGSSPVSSAQNNLPIAVGVGTVAYFILSGMAPVLLGYPPFYTNI